MGMIAWKRVAMAASIPTAMLCLNLLLITLLEGLLSNLDGWKGTVALILFALSMVVAVILPGMIAGRALERHPFFAGLAVGFAGWTFSIFGVIVFNALLSLVVRGLEGGGQGLGIAMFGIWVVGL